ncbi:MAG: PEP-CTERM sorting domain-containing protein [Pseudomonadota bacterium]
MKFALKASLTTFVFALIMPLAATADVTYTYTGSNFTDVSAMIIHYPNWPTGEVYEDVAAEAAVKESLLSRGLYLSLTTPVYLPAGWSTFSTAGGYSGALLTSMINLEQHHGMDNPGISWSANSGLWNDHGKVALHNDPANVEWDLSTSLHVNASGIIDAWEFSLLSSDAYAIANAINQTNMGGSSSNGDAIDWDASAPRWLTDHRAASTAAIGSWASAGSPVLAVPEPATYAMLLAGLGLIGFTARRTHRRPA